MLNKKLRNCNFHQAIPKNIFVFVLQSELERFQESLSRCVLQCQDEVKDKVKHLNKKYFFFHFFIHCSLKLHNKLSCVLKIKEILNKTHLRGIDL